MFFMLPITSLSNIFSILPFFFECCNVMAELVMDKCAKSFVGCNKKSSESRISSISTILEFS